MFARFSIVLIAVLAMTSTFAAACTPVCCPKKLSDTPSGYQESNCKKADDTPYGECTWMACCNYFKDGTAAVCTEPQPGDSA
ncbi:hypothetical protein V8E55_008173 [Tylopilus felleus]